MDLHLVSPNLQLPWHSAEGEDKRFWHILGWCSLPLILLATVIPLIETPEPEREQLNIMPPQLARVVLEEKVPEEKTPEEAAPDEPEPEPESTPEETPPQTPPEPRPEQTVEQAREKAQRSGVLKFADDLAAMRNQIDTAAVDNANKAATNGDNSVGSGDAAQLDRAVVASQSKAGSGGVSNSALSRDTGGAGLSGREETRVENKLANEEDEAWVGKDGRPIRSDEDIRKVMDSNKSAVFAIYNRALRTDPTLQGRIVVQLVIEPSGRVSTARIISSDLDDQDLESKILARIRMINFGTEDVPEAKLNYELDFLPS